MTRDLFTWLKPVAVAAVLLMANVGAARASDDDIITRGAITAIDSTTVTVDAVIYTINDGTEYEDSDGNSIDFADLGVSDVVKAKGQFESGVLIAESIEQEEIGEDNGGGDDDSDEIEVEGLVTAKTDSTFTVQGTTFTVNDATNILDDENQTIAFSTIVVGTKVNVKADSGAPTLAVRIKVENESLSDDDDDDDSLSGHDNDTASLGELTSKAEDSFVVRGVTYHVSSKTRFENRNDRPMTFADLEVGMFVKVEFGVAIDGSKVAREVEVEDSETSGAEFEVKGEISALSDTSITVRGITANLNGSTRYRGAHGTSATLADLSVGLLVKMSGERLDSTTNLARQVRIRERQTLGDFDDNGVSEKVMYRPSTNTWLINYGTDANHDGRIDSETRKFGKSSDTPLFMDADGDRRTDIAIYRPSNSTWYVLLSSTGYVLTRTVQWGLSGDLPVPGDYDGDGKTDFAVWRPGTGHWYAFLSSGGSRTKAIAGDPAHMLSRQWGLSTHEPIPNADRDGDGRDDFVVWDSQTGTWHTLYSSSGYNRSGALAGNTSAGDSIQFGLGGDSPEVGDFDGDGKDDIAVFRNGTWYQRRSSGEVKSVAWGQAGDSAAVLRAADRNRERRDGLTVYRPGKHRHFDRIPNGKSITTKARTWGKSDDLPVGHELEFERD